MSCIDDELWIDFSHALSDDLKVGDRNLHIFQWIVGTTFISLMIHFDFEQLQALYSPVICHIHDRVQISATITI